MTFEEKKQLVERVFQRAELTPNFGGDILLVIAELEKAWFDLEQLTTKNQRLTATLEFYADEKNHNHVVPYDAGATPVSEDYGKKARDVLNDISPRREALGTVESSEALNK